MEFDHRFGVPLSPVEAWRLLADLDRVAPCLPGVTVRRRDATRWDAQATLRVVGMSFSAEGTVTLAARDQAGLSLRYRVEGDGDRSREPTRTDISLRVTPSPEGATVLAHAIIELPGAAGRSGRGLAHATAQRLLDEFSARLRAEIGGHPSPLPAAAHPRRPRPRAAPLRLRLSPLIRSIEKLFRRN